MNMIMKKYFKSITLPFHVLNTILSSSRILLTRTLILSVWISIFGNSVRSIAFS